MKIDCKTTLCLAALGLLSPLARAQFCNLTNSSLTGAYGYVANEAGAVVTTTGTSSTTSTGTTGTGTTTTTTTTTSSGYSSTNLGALLGGISASNQLALSGVLVFDGAGNVSAASTPGGAAVHVGTYNVNSDCSVSVSLTDVFGTITSATKFAGIVLGGGQEIDLTSQTSLQSYSKTGTTTTGGGTSIGTGTTSTGTTTSTSTTSTGGLNMRLVRVFLNNGCSDSNLNGLYGFVLNPQSAQVQNSSTTTGTTTGTGTGTGTGTTGTGTTATTTSSPFALIGYVDFNGAGKIVAIPSNSSASSNATTTTFSALQYIGTYTVNMDCSGTLTISNSDLPSSTSTGTTTGTSAGSSLTINFVITPPSLQAGSNQAPGLDLSYSLGDASGTGYAAAQ
jgi:hypothetical protein